MRTSPSKLDRLLIGKYVRKTTPFTEIDLYSEAYICILREYALWRKQRKWWSTKIILIMFDLCSEEDIFFFRGKLIFIKSGGKLENFAHKFLNMHPFKNLMIEIAMIRALLHFYAES